MDTELSKVNRGSIPTINMLASSIRISTSRTLIHTSRNHLRTSFRNNTHRDTSILDNHHSNNNKIKARTHLCGLLLLALQFGNYLEVLLARQKMIPVCLSKRSYVSGRCNHHHCRGFDRWSTW
jgi:hypothetical protein